MYTSSLTAEKKKQQQQQTQTKAKFKNIMRLMHPIITSQVCWLMQWSACEQCADWFHELLGEVLSSEDPQ